MAYRYYVENTLAMPAMIGTHWFQWTDEANTGRGDGENYNIGFIDVTDRPYAESRASRQGDAQTAVRGALRHRESVQSKGGDAVAPPQANNSCARAKRSRTCTPFAHLTAHSAQSPQRTLRCSAESPRKFSRASANSPYPSA